VAAAVWCAVLLNKQIENQVLTIVRDFLTESKAERATRAVAVDALLEQDLGIGSLEKAELFHRFEKAFAVRLPDQVMIEAKSINDIIIAISTAQPAQPISVRDIQPTLEAVEMDLSSSETLLDVLFKYAQEKPDRPHIYLPDEKNHEQIITYGKLFQQAKATALGLIHYGLKPGETVAIMLPTCEDFFYVFFGVLLAGGIPVPIYPPYRPDRIEEYAKRETNVLSNAEVRLLVTFQRAEGLSKLLHAFIPSLLAVVTADALLGFTGELPSLALEGENPALIQYTSGSTGTPKGVLLTHQNLLANIRSVSKAAGLRPSDVGVSWLPLYHDMGLIGAWLGSFYRGTPVTIFSPITFLSHPESWLWAIHYHRGTLSGAPNFAYELCVNKIDEKDIQGLDLSSWRMAFNGAEAIYPKTLVKFSKKFAPYGFKPESHFPVYGLAEATVALTFPPVGRKPRIDRISRDALEKMQQAVPVNETAKDYLEFVSCGKALPDHEIRIVDEAGDEVAERTVGTLQFSGPSAMQGYYRNPVATQAIYHNGWWDSGDFAYMAEGEIYITGRKKDVIIKGGRNLYPDAVEEITGHIAGVRNGCVVAFGAGDAKSGTEKFVIVAEIRAKEFDQLERINTEIIAAVSAAVGIPPDEVILVPPKTIPKTSSGKLQRSACKQMYLQNKLVKNRLPVWLQLSKLFLSGLSKKIARHADVVGRFFYAAYIGLILLITLPFLWLVAAVASSTVVVKTTKTWAKTLLRIVGCPLTVVGRANLTQFSSMIFVANHASYIDALVLITILPDNVAFVGKKELFKLPLLRTILKKLQMLTVDRIDFSQNVTDIRRIGQTLKDNRSIFMFPEGTFTYATGLRPFKQGAFKIAVDLEKPICPIAIQGTRAILRDTYWLPRPGAIKVTIGKPIVPQEKGWHEVVRLRTEARIEIAEHCGEQVIDLVAAGVRQRNPKNYT